MKHFPSELLSCGHSEGKHRSCSVLQGFCGPFLEVPSASRDILQSDVLNCCPFSSLGPCAAGQQGAVSFPACASFLRIFPGCPAISLFLSANSWTLRNRHPHKQNDIMRNRPQILAHQQTDGILKGEKKTALERLAWFYRIENVAHPLPVQSTTA